MSHVIVNSGRSGDKMVTVQSQVIHVAYQPSAARRAEIAAAPALKEAAEKPAEKRAPVKTAAPAKGKRKPRLRETARRTGADDLKKISGIGNVLEQTLNEQGIFHFDQIAGWDDANLAWIDENWGCGNKVRRDKWISQAKKLAKAT